MNAVSSFVVFLAQVRPRNIPTVLANDLFLRYLTAGKPSSFITCINRLLAVQVQVLNDDIHVGLLLLLISPCPILYIYLRGATCGSVRYKQVYILTKLRFKPLPPSVFAAARSGSFFLYPFFLLLPHTLLPTGRRFGHITQKRGAKRPN